VGAELAIVRLTAADIEDAADVLARSFCYDPCAIHVLPEEEHREDLLFWYFGTMVQYGLRFGEVVATANGGGVAVWLPSDSEQHDVDRVRHRGLVDAPEVLGAEGFTRLVGITGHLDRVRKMLLPPQHWYLPAIGVDPAHQGRGVGGALLRWGCSRADVAGAPCYLETFRQRNAAFYERHGFARALESVVPGSDLRFWIFRRNPVEAPQDG
jgi:ribosomal protein S18 acetylase RimI-like enzyme